MSSTVNSPLVDSRNRQYGGAELSDGGSWSSGPDETWHPDTLLFGLRAARVSRGLPPGYPEEVPGEEVGLN